MGTIEEAVEEYKKEGKRLSSLAVLQPLPSGIKEIGRFKKVMTIENNWSDRVEDKSLMGK